MGARSRGSTLTSRGQNDELRPLPLVPDGARAGLVRTLDTQPRFGVLHGPEQARWGVFHFAA